jgi:hypothetical protein
MVSLGKTEKGLGWFLDRPNRLWVNINCFFQTGGCQAILRAKFKGDSKIMSGRIIRELTRIDIGHRSGFTCLQVKLIQIQNATVIRSKVVRSMGEDRRDGIICDRDADGIPVKSAVIGDVEPEGKVSGTTDHIRENDRIAGNRCGGGRRGVKRQPGSIPHHGGILRPDPADDGRIGRQPR